MASSPFHLARVFRRETGIPVHRHLTRLRLSQALEELSGGHEDLTELALRIGFSSHAHFTSSFSRTFGVTPSEFRRGATKARLCGSREKLASGPLLASR